LLKAARENNDEEVKEWLEKRANPCYEEDGWNALLWASCNGNEDIVRALIKPSVNAAAKYMDGVKTGDTEDKLDTRDEE